jgi:ribonuclease VapC
MVIDTSAIMAILQLEPEARRFSELIEQASVRLVSAVSVLEAGILVDVRAGSIGARELDAFLQQAELRIVPFDYEQATIARDAWRRFGKGRHVAQLNFGDCATYALARGSGEPLLFKGNDFSKTDVTTCDVGPV